jgi:ABC-2 type transport system permease protein
MTSRENGPRRLARILAAESRAEFLKLLRLPAFVVPTLAFPVMFYLLFAVAFGAGRAAGGVSMATYMVATYGTFGVMGAAFGGLGIGIAVERGQGWLTVKRASPMPGIAYFGAKMAISMAFGAVIVALLFALGATLGHVRLPAASWAALAAVLILGAVPFCALGCALGFGVGPNAAPAIANLVFLPMAFASGLWIPLEALPPAFRALAPALPPYHLSRLALGVVGLETAGAATHLAALAGFTVVFALAAAGAYRRDEGRTYG